MAKEKKGLAALILAGAPKDAPAEAPMEEVSPLRSAAEEVLEAVEMKDAALLEESLKAFVELCKDQEYPAEESEME